MTMRTDMANNVQVIRKLCRGVVAVTDAHWAEAKEAVGDDKKRQESYLKVEASRGLMDGCEEPCSFGVAAALTYDGNKATVTATCNADPRLRW